MAEVRDFNAYRKSRAANKKTEVPREAGRPVQSRAQGSVKRGTWFRAISVLVVIAILGLVSYFSWRDKTFSQASVISNVNIADAQAVTSAGLADCILQYSKDGVSLVQPSGEVVWNQTYEMQNPMLDTCGNYAAIADYNGRTVYVMDTTAPIGEFHTNLPIRAFQVASQGVVAVVLDDTDVTWINLYNTDGTELAAFRTTMGDSGYPLSVALSPNGRMVCVSFLRVEGGHAKTSIAFYNFGSVGQNESDNFVGGYDYPDCIVPRVCFLDDSHLYAISTDRIMFFEGAEVPKPGRTTMLGSEEIRAVYESEAGVAVCLPGGSDEGAYRLQAYDNKGEPLFTRFLDVEYKGLAFGNRFIVLYNSDTWRILGADGSDRYEGSFDFTVRAVLPTSVRDRYILAGTDRIQTIELK